MPTTKQQNKKPSAFTLVELIVVIVILSILATIAFLSFSSQSGSARDSTRLSDIASIKKGFEMFNVNSGLYPAPDAAIAFTYSGGVIWNQGVLGDNAYKLIQKTLSKKVKDPLKDTEYDYSLSANKREYQVAGSFENSTSFEKSYNPFDSVTKSFALGGSGTNVYISGNYNGVVLKVQSGSTYFYIPSPSLFGIYTAGQTSVTYDSSFASGKILLPGISSTATFNPMSIYTTTGATLSSTGVLDMMKVLQSAYTGSNIAAPLVQQIMSADTSTLNSLGNGLIKNVLGGSVSSSNSTSVSVQNGTSSLDPASTCSTIKSAYPGSADGNYWINPSGTGAMQVYCDMTTGIGGWAYKITDSVAIASKYYIADNGGNNLEVKVTCDSIGTNLRPYIVSAERCYAAGTYKSWTAEELACENTYWQNPANPKILSFFYTFYDTTGTPSSGCVISWDCRYGYVKAMKTTYRCK